MSTDNERLIVELEARITQFEKAFAKASGTANTHWSKIETRGRQATRRIEADIEKASSQMAGSFKAVATSIATKSGIGGALGLTAVLATAVAVNAELVEMAGLAKRVELPLDQIQEIKYATQQAGMSNADFTSGLDGLARALNDALRDENELSRLFAANNVQLKDRNGKLIGVNEALARAADLMRNAASEQDKIKLAEMLGMTRSWVGVLDKGAAAFNATAGEARAAGAVIDSNIIRKAQDFDREWTKATAKWTAAVKAGAAEILPDLTALATKAIEVVQSLSDYARQTLIAAKLNENVALTVKELGEAIALARSKGSPVDPSWIAEYERLLELQREAHRGRKVTGNEPAPQPAPSDQPKTVIPPAAKAENDKDAFTRAQDGARKRIALIEADTLAVGQNEAARERLRTVAELEEAAKRANREAGLADISVTQQQRAEIDKLADATLIAAQKQEQAKRSFDAINQSVQYFGNVGIDIFDRMAQGGEKLGDVLEDVRKMLVKATAQALLLGEGPLAGLFGTKSTVAGGTGGILGSIFGGFRAEGGPVAPGRAYVVGEKRPEIFVPRVPGSILPKIPTGGSVQSSTVFSAPITVQVEGGSRGAEADNALAEKIGQEVEQRVRAIVGKELRGQMRPGGLLNNMRWS